MDKRTVLCAKCLADLGDPQNPDVCPNCGREDLFYPKDEQTWEFTVTLIGRGEDEDAAWRDAVDAFANDPGNPDSAFDITDYSEVSDG